MPLIEFTTDDALLVEHYRLHWLEMGIGSNEVRDDWRSEAFCFLREAREQKGFGAFAARKGDDVLGTACCQITQRTFPPFRKVDARLLGYLWGVYVRPEHRGRGLGGLLVKACMSHLKSVGCGRVLLHAGERSNALYSRMGFRPTDELSAPL
jgi:GNAT superfamily N-acetyltransferase